MLIDNRRKNLFPLELLPKAFVQINISKNTFDKGAMFDVQSQLRYHGSEIVCKPSMVTPIK